MLRILLCCSAGMSTSLLVAKMQSAARNANFACEIEAMSVTEGKLQTEKWDVILIGPQVVYALAEFKKITTKPIAIIPPQIYATAKGKDAIELAQKLAAEGGIKF